METAKIRAWWSQRQGLDGRLAGGAEAEVLERTGWARSVGGVGPYLTLWARAGARRDAVDAAVARLEIYELPGARGCTYVVPAADFAPALKTGQAFGEGEMNTARKLGVTDSEIGKLCEAVVRALEGGPLAPDELREAAGGAVRNLGAEGVKKGLASTLPVALGKLQSSGDIRRVAANGRLDQQRYRYALWRPNPLATAAMSPEEAYAELARRYFRWIGPATPAEFQGFSGLGVKAARAAMEPLGLVEIENGRLMFPEDREALASFKIPREPRYVLVSSLDGIALLRRDLTGLLDEADRKRKVFVEKGYAEAGGLKDLPSHAILDRGRLVGLWEYDPDAQSIAWMSFVEKNRDLEQAVARAEEFVRTDLGDARSFSLDSPKSRKPRIEALRKAGAGK